MKNQKSNTINCWSKIFLITLFLYFCSLTSIGKIVVATPTIFLAVNLAFIAVSFIYSNVILLGLCKLLLRYKKTKMVNSNFELPSSSLIALSLWTVTIFFQFAILIGIGTTSLTSEQFFKFGNSDVTNMFIAQAVFVAITFISFIVISIVTYILAKTYDFMLTESNTSLFDISNFIVYFVTKVAVRVREKRNQKVAQKVIKINGKSQFSKMFNMNVELKVNAKQAFALKQAKKGTTPPQLSL
ncbi:hypothetical protein CXP39_00740 [Mesoplasma syrphidae]|uniref:Uncharacterized protein n=1 Tax=Mesoplasma syrphidae TaxID=225999 RepID=A0A2K9BJ62_9MOLU|nr:hypothetical protein [Mesoplasma syrphidae]AUF83336.1 hypothetical protein CXP39_00740 [Mesoplasma syrphidae]